MRPRAYQPSPPRLFLAGLALLCGCAGGPAPTPRVAPATPSSAGPLALNAGRCTLQGHFREFNDHALALERLPQGAVYLLADGIGGEKAGTTASRRAVELLPKKLQQHFPKALDVEPLRQAIRRALVETNDDLLALAAADPDLRNQGASIVWAVWPGGNELYVNGVGDCRAYLVRGGRIEQLTVDQTLAQALVEAKTITPEEARTHRFRNVLWKYLGSKEVGDGTDVRVVGLQPGDHVLLATVGITGVVADEELLRQVGLQAQAQPCAEALCQVALNTGSRDNVSCWVLAVTAKP
jgi:serine/threonine protein phosphatase PrpC